MTTPTTKDEFKAYVLRKLGAPVIKINVTEEQVDDRVDQALKFWTDYHYDGSEKQYYKIQVTDDMKTDGYVTMPANVFGVVRIFPLSDSFVGGGMFNATYQWVLSNIETWTGPDLVPYYTAFSHLQFMEQILIGQVPIRYNRHTNKLYLDVNWDKVVTGSYLIAECHMVINPATYADVWSDKWLQDYAAALVYKQWQEHLSKFGNVQTVGGVYLQPRLEEAEAEVQRLEDLFMRTFNVCTAFEVM